MRDDYDRSSKWLIQHHGDSILRLGGVGGVKSWRSLQTDLVQPRRLADGLLEVYFLDQTDPSPFIVEIATLSRAASSQTSAARQHAGLSGS